MRPDMGKVITERPRSLGEKRARKGYRKELQRDGIDRVRYESMKDRCGGTKVFTDVFGPLVGFLHKSCGKPWDLVMSEVNEALPATGGVSYSHARDHLFWMVEEHTQLIDGEYYDSKGLPISGGWRWREFFVDVNGILREAKPRESRWRNLFKREKKTFPKTDAGEWIIFDKQHTHVWYACEMASYKSTGNITRQKTTAYLRNYSYTEPVYPIVFDVFLKCTVARPHMLTQFYGANVYCVNKRQLNKREIRKYKLTSANKMMAA